MRKRVVSVLLIGGGQHAKRIKTALSMTDKDFSFVLHQSDDFVQELPLPDRSAEFVLLVWKPAQGCNPDIILKIKRLSARLPVVVLVEAWSKADAVTVLRAGAQDVITQQDVSLNLLPRALITAMERQKLLVQLQNAALLDELTGLYNRRGFMEFAGHYLKMAERSKRGMLLIYADVDCLKQINDHQGHQAGDQAILASAAVLKSVLRISDIVARIGGDEFAALALDTDAAFEEKIFRRLETEKAGCRYSLTLSIGFSYYDPFRPSSIDELLDAADKNMYERKREQKKQKEGIVSCTTCMPTYFPG